jgi:hypothetical protein
MIQLSRLPRCFARAEGDTSTGPKSSYRKVGTVRTRRTITGGPLRQLEDLRLGCVEDCQVLASDEARKSGGLPVSAIDGGPALQIGTQPSAGLDLETAGPLQPSLGHSDFWGIVVSLSVAEPLSTRYGCPCFSRPLFRRSAEIVRTSGSTDTPMSRSGSTSSFSESGVDQMRRGLDAERPSAISEVCGLSTLV